MGKVVGFEISSQNSNEATKFYQEVFGWNNGEENWDYWPVSTAETSINGGIAKGESEYPQRTRIQIEVDCSKQQLENQRRAARWL
ncbi:MULTISPECIES: hypothetical protein [unclassified Sutcliffiella]|uniref:VOC family protein n=1 Tax=unclassified Sutcliffiella TaxID=2837532 RepID=UPI0030CE27C1